MPEYLAPGVYIEETSYRAKSIEGVSTSTAGFVGPARFGPVEGMPELITSFAEFGRVFGGLEQLSFANEAEPSHNYLAHGVRAFFENGGKRVYITRIFERGSAANGGHASRTIDGVGGAPGITLRSRFPGQAGNMRIAFRFRVGANVLALENDPLEPANRDKRYPVLRGVTSDELVWVQDPISMPDPARENDVESTGTLYRARRTFDDVANRWTWHLHSDTTTLDTTGQPLEGLAGSGDIVRRVSASVEVSFLDGAGQIIRRDQWEDLTFHPGHRRSFGTIFAADLPNRAQQLSIPFVFVRPGGSAQHTGLGILRSLLASLDATSFPTDYASELLRADQKETMFTLTGGTDGERPKPETYEGQEIDPKRKSGLAALADIPDISIVAAPGYSQAAPDADSETAATRAMAIMQLLLSHCERVRYSIAVLDSIEGQAIPDIRKLKAQVDSTRGALYYPFVRVIDSVTDKEINLPPSGFVAGIYARNDVEFGVHKAPANEVVRGAVGFEVMVNKSQQDVLNPEHINVLRFFEGRGYRVWGARTTSSDPEWKYVNVRRYFLYLERSIERGTQWAVFENNGDALWANVRRTIEDFLYNEWNSGRLLGLKPEDAYFVRCDRTTMTQNDLDNGRLVCLIGVAPLRPAEFVIFRIGQWTASRAT